jgi:glycine cleavage system H protein
MSLEYPEDLKYLDSHEFVSLDGDVATVGVTAFAVDQLGDVVFIELPQAGDELTQGAVMGTIESVKAVEDLYAPVSGAVLETNQAIMDAPENLASDPYRQGWLIKVKISNPAELEGTLSAAAYRQLLEGA